MQANTTSVSEILPGSIDTYVNTVIQRSAEGCGFSLGTAVSSYT